MGIVNGIAAWILMMWFIIKNGFSLKKANEDADRVLAELEDEVAKGIWDRR